MFAAVALESHATLVWPCVVARRFASASRLLKDSFGPRLEDAPPHALLLWLALALDTEARREAQQLLQDLLDRRQPGGEAGGMPDGAARAAPQRLCASRRCARPFMLSVQPSWHAPGRHRWRAQEQARHAWHGRVGTGPGTVPTCT